MPQDHSDLGGPSDVSLDPGASWRILTTLVCSAQVGVNGWRKKPNPLAGRSMTTTHTHVHTHTHTHISHIPVPFQTKCGRCLLAKRTHEGETALSRAVVEHEHIDWSGRLKCVPPKHEMGYCGRSLLLEAVQGEIQNILQIPVCQIGDRK